MLLSFSFITDHQDSYSSMIFILFSIYNLFTHTCYTVRKHKGTRFQSVFHITIIHQMWMQPQWNSGNWRDKPHRDFSPASAATELLASITFICTFIVQVFHFFFFFLPWQRASASSRYSHFHLGIQISLSAETLQIGDYVVRMLTIMVVMVL